MRFLFQPRNRASLRFNVLVEPVCSELSSASKPANRQEREENASSSIVELGKLDAMRLAMLLRLTILFSVLLPVRAQQAQSSIASPHDAARNLLPITQSSLSEQYIWTAGDVTDDPCCTQAPLPLPLTRSRSLQPVTPSLPIAHSTSLHLSIKRECCITFTAPSRARIQTRIAASPSPAQDPDDDVKR
jgi:hypothetical protein